jgi:hypothetical protein
MSRLGELRVDFARIPGDALRRPHGNGRVNGFVSFKGDKNGVDRYLSF